MVKSSSLLLTPKCVRFAEIDSDHENEKNQRTLETRVRRRKKWVEKKQLRQKKVRTSMVDTN